MGGWIALVPGEQLMEETSTAGLVSDSRSDEWPSGARLGDEVVAEYVVRLTNSLRTRLGTNVQWQPRRYRCAPHTATDLGTGARAGDLQPMYSAKPAEKPQEQQYRENDEHECEHRECQDFIDPAPCRPFEHT